MGNCLALQENIVNIMETDDEILEYRAPMKEQQFQVPSPEFDEKSSNTKAAAKEKNSGVVRIKLIISKQELEAMLSKGGVSVEDMIYQLQKKQNATPVVDCADNGNCKGWKPVLESIPEVN